MVGGGRTTTGGDKRRGKGGGVEEAYVLSDITVLLVAAYCRNSTKGKI